MSSEDDDLREWLLEAGDYAQVRKNPSFLLFLAAVGMKTGSIGQNRGYQHVVVDEAQDIRPVEWWMLTKLFRDGTEPRWSLFGDMNQRRSDFTWDSWDLLTDRLEPAAADAQPEPPAVLGTGYRSTREILRKEGLWGPPVRMDQVGWPIRWQGSSWSRVICPCVVWAGSGRALQSRSGSSTAASALCAAREAGVPRRVFLSRRSWPQLYIDQRRHEHSHARNQHEHLK